MKFKVTNVMLVC